MNKKLLNYGLGAWVLLIWAGVCLRFSGGCSREHPTAPRSAPPPITGEAADFHLIRDYPDPFLAPSKSLSPVHSQINMQEQLAVLTKPALAPPPLLYLGGVCSPRDTGMTGLVRLDSRIFPVKAGEQVKDWEVQKLSLDTLVLRHKTGTSFRFGRGTLQPPFVLTQASLP